MNENNTYPIFNTNGRLFPLWILKNFKKYKLDPIIKKEGEDPCNTTTLSGVKELRKYQSFIGSYLDYRSPYKDILIYHGLGSGKTATAVNVYNMLYNYNPDWNVYVLIKASLRNDPWLRDLNEWLKDKEIRMINIRFIHYDSPRADKDFIEAVKSGDIQKKNIYIIEEAHNFINNVFNNIISKTGRRAYTIYDYIQREKKENPNTRVMLLSGTPAINNPFELALIFNLLRPDIFPMSEMQFNDLYISDGKIPKLNNNNKNMFQRRIMGLVSYYYGSTKDLFAEKNIVIKKIPMDKYQLEVYDHFENIEDQLEKKRMSKKGAGTRVYRSYTRQASNFVFPIINQQITGDSRPRPGKFRLSDDDVQKIMEGKTENLLKSKSANELTKFKTDMILYIDTIKKYVTEFNNYLIKKHDDDVKDGYTIFDDINLFKTEYKFKFKNFWENSKKSSLLKTMFACSCKMTSILFYMLRSQGPILVYSNYVKMEGLEIFKIYLRMIGFGEYEKDQVEPYHSYTEFHGEIDKDIRSKNLKDFNNPENITGSLIRVILISPAGAEGISLMNVRQVHILEPYWNEVRIEQLIGRAVRQCSHKMLPMEDRKVDIFRYLAVRSDKKDKLTTDQEIYDGAKAKSSLIETFLSTIKEVAVDCELFKNHNMMNETYPCFKFNEKSYFEGYIGPSYKEDIYYDKKIDNGLNAISSENKKIKVIKIKAVYKINNDYSKSENYWYNNETGVVYDYDLDFPVGKVYITNGIPNKLDKDTYIIDQLIDIPSVYVL